MIEDPNQPGNIDEYIYLKGKWQEPTPVQLRGDGDLKSNLTPLDQISFVKLAEITKAWSEKAKELEATETTPSVISFVLIPHTQDRFWRVDQINAPRARYYLDFQPDGTPRELKKD